MWNMDYQRKNYKDYRSKCGAAEKCGKYPGRRRRDEKVLELMKTDPEY